MPERGVFSALIFLFACVILFKTLGLRGDVALVPKMAAILLLAFAGVQLLMDLSQNLRERLPLLSRDATDGIGGEGVVQETDAEGDTAGARYRFFGWVAGFIALIGLTSMIWATLIALFVWLKWIRRESWRLAALYSLGATLFIYLVFVLGFKLHHLL